MRREPGRRKATNNFIVWTSGWENVLCICRTLRTLLRQVQICTFVKNKCHPKDYNFLSIQEVIRRRLRWSACLCCKGHSPLSFFLSHPPALFLCLLSLCGSFFPPLGVTDWIPRNLSECLNWFEQFSIGSLLCWAWAPCQPLGIWGAARPSGLV